MKFEPTLVIQPIFFGKVVTILMGFHCILKINSELTFPKVFLSQLSSC